LCRGERRAVELCRDRSRGLRHFHRIEVMKTNRLRLLRSACFGLFLFATAAGCEFSADFKDVGSNGARPAGPTAGGGSGEVANPEDVTDTSSGSASTDGSTAAKPASAGNSGHLVSAVQASDFQQKVLAHDQPVLVDFWAPWCGPCRSQAPILEKLASEMDGRVRIVKLNVDEPGNSTLAQKHGIKAIPTLLLFQDGKVVGRFVGLQQKETLAAALNKRL
ncbi:MAG TPA: thioredoxin, partial [Pirellulaceae bacterium]|nr:thioredoxin [Pirellulaceae bacterium]